VKTADDAASRPLRSGVRPGVAPMRILLASDYYAPFIGGVQRQIQLIGRELVARGHAVEVVTVWSPGFAAAEDDGGVRVNRVRQIRSVIRGAARPGQHHPPPFPDPVMTAGLRRIVRRFRPDVVHSYGWLSYSCAAALLGRNTPLVVSARDYAYGCAVRTLVEGGHMCSGPEALKCLGCASDYYGRHRGWLAMLGVRASAGLLRSKVTSLHSISAHVRDMVRRDFLDDRAAGIPHVVLPSFGEGVAPDPEPALGPLLARLPTQPYILFVGALRREKGVEPLLTAYAQLVDPPPLVLAGTRERDTPPIPAGVTVLEDLPHPAVMAAWRGALFGVAPSLWAEPLGSVVYEAMSMGRAIIGTVPGGHADMIEDGVTGLLVPAGDAAALRDAMEALIADPARCGALGRRGEVRARRFTAATVVPELERLYALSLGRVP
jgi:glycosyltransferase involved in cell wall biosynthesis